MRAQAAIALARLQTEPSSGAEALAAMRNAVDNAGAMRHLQLELELRMAAAVILKRLGRVEDAKEFLADAPQRAREKGFLRYLREMENVFAPGASGPESG